MLSTASSLSPDFTVPDSVVEEWIFGERLEQKKKLSPSRKRSSIGRLPKNPTLIIESKTDAQSTTSKTKT